MSKTEIFLPAIKPEEKLAKTRATAPIPYWIPHGHNNWVGDVGPDLTVKKMLFRMEGVELKIVQIARLKE